MGRNFFVIFCAFLTGVAWGLYQLRRTALQQIALAAGVAATVMAVVTYPEGEVEPVFVASGPTTPATSPCVEPALRPPTTSLQIDEGRQGLPDLAQPNGSDIATVDQDPFGRHSANVLTLGGGVGAQSALAIGAHRYLSGVLSDRRRQGDDLYHPRSVIQYSLGGDHHRRPHHPGL